MLRRSFLKLLGLSPLVVRNENLLPNENTSVKQEPIKTNNNKPGFGVDLSTKPETYTYTTSNYKTIFLDMKVL